LSQCGFTQEERYRLAYRKDTNGWTNYTELIQITRQVQSWDPTYDIGESGGWSQTNPQAVNFWESKFDVNMMIYYAILTGILGAWDDFSTNYYLYKRTLNDGKWHMMVKFLEISRKIHVKTSHGMSKHCLEENCPV
jgi:hypothetical protein